MVDVIGLTRHLRAAFPYPANYGEILGEMADFLDLDASDDELLAEPDKFIDKTDQLHAYRGLYKMWQREGWVWDNNIGGVLPSGDEGITFEDDTIIIATGRGSSTLVLALSHGEVPEGFHDRIVWF